MKKYISIISILCATINCNSQPKTTSINFLKYVNRYAPDTNGRISCGPLCKENGKIIGIFDGYLIHKNGGNWWYREAKKRFPKDIENCEFKMAKKLLKEDKDSLDNYNKWVFFTDIKYLFKSNYLHGETGKEIESVEYYENKPLEIILYQQLAGTKEWVEIDRRFFKSEEEHRKSNWESSFIKKKLAESNLPKK